MTPEVDKALLQMGKSLRALRKDIQSGRKRDLIKVKFTIHAEYVITALPPVMQATDRLRALTSQLLNKLRL